MRSVVDAVVLALGLALAAPAVAQTCSGLGPIGTLLERLAAPVDPALAEAFCADYGAMATRLSEAELRAQQLAAEVAALQAALPPPEAILLIDRAQGCPAGWRDVAVAEPDVFAGRVAVATGFAESRVFRGFRETGGSETHALTEAELPAHGHGLPLEFQRLLGEGLGGSNLGSRLTTGTQVAVATRIGREATGRVGAAQPHPTMPPYVALFFCQRD